jgi:hypothetical protein
MGTYDELDKAILAAIEGGAKHFYLINASVEGLARPHSIKGDSFRVVERRLQALRKSGLIAFEKKEWMKS